LRRLYRNRNAMAKRHNTPASLEVGAANGMAGKRFRVNALFPMSFKTIAAVRM